MKLAILAAAAAALAVAAPAAAVTYLYSFASTGGDTGSGYLTTATTGTSAITSIIGTVDGSTITGLSSYAGSDNTLYMPAPYLSLGGTSVSTTSGTAYNVYFDGTNYNIIDSVTSPAGDGTNARNLTSFTLTAVPEPAAWGLMITGFAMTGFAARRRNAAIAA